MGSLHVVVQGLLLYFWHFPSVAGPNMGPPRSLIFGPPQVHVMLNQAYMLEPWCRLMCDNMSSSSSSSSCSESREGLTVGSGSGVISPMIVSLNPMNPKS